MITKAERIHGVPAHHNAWSVTYDCGHTEHISVKKDEQEPFVGSRTVHKGCPSQPQAPNTPPPPLPPLPMPALEDSPEAVVRRELVETARSLLAIAKARIRTNVYTPTEEEMRCAIQPTIVRDQMEDARTADTTNTTTFEFYYLGRSGSLREQITEECFLGHDEDYPRHSGYYAVEAYQGHQERKLSKLWIAVVRHDEGPSFDEKHDAEAAARIAEAAAACFRAATGSSPRGA